MLIDVGEFFYFVIVKDDKNVYVYFILSKVGLVFDNELGFILENW